MKVFWRHGYEGASLAELTKAMGINRPSMYATFGDKESLFLRAVDRYIASHACHVEEAIREPTVRRVVQRLWRSNIELASLSTRPRGCLLVQGALACGSRSKGVQKEMSARRAAGEAMLRERFDRAVAEGELSSQVDTAGLARYVATINYGMSILASGGASAEELRAVAKIAISALPG